jgi:Protein of unknown function (DUF3572)
VPARPEDVRQVAETVAIHALSFLGAEPARLGRFLAESGLGPETLRAASKSPQFLISVLDFLLSDEAMTADFARETELTPAAVAAARQALGGPDWERDVP